MRTSNGGYPCKDLRHKFLLAAQSNAESLTENELPDGFEVIKLPRHFFDMVGFRTPDDIVFLADCLSSKNILEKYRISFIKKRSAAKTPFFSAEIIVRRSFCF